jgi:hypothetical protein
MFYKPSETVSSCSFSYHPHPLSLLYRFVDSVVQLTTNIAITTLGYLMFRQGSGLSYHALESFRHPVKVMLLPLSATLCMSLVGIVSADTAWVI